MIRTDGIRTIANPGPIPGQLDLVEEVAKVEAEAAAFAPFAARKLDNDDLLAQSA